MPTFKERYVVTSRIVPVSLFRSEEQWSVEYDDYTVIIVQQGGKAMAESIANFLNENNVRFTPE